MVKSQFNSLCSQKGIVTRAPVAVIADLHKNRALAYIKEGLSEGPTEELAQIERFKREAI